MSYDRSALKRPAAQEAVRAKLAAVPAVSWGMDVDAHVHHVKARIWGILEEECPKARAAPKAAWLSEAARGLIRPRARAAAAVRKPA